MVKRFFIARANNQPGRIAQFDTQQALDAFLLSDAASAYAYHQLSINVVGNRWVDTPTWTQAQIDDMRNA